MTCIIAFLLMLSPLAHAQEGTVKKVKGSRAVVDFNAPVQTGDAVKVVDEFEDEPAPARSPAKKQRPRETGLDWHYYSRSKKSSASGSVSALSTTVAVPETTSKSQSAYIAASYVHNIGQWEVGGTLSRETSKDSSSEDEEFELAALAQYNFITNRAGNDTVPYIFISAGYVGGEGSSGGFSGDTKGTSTTVALGLLWFPFSELFAVDIGYSSRTANMTMDAQGAVSGVAVTGELKGKETTSGLYAGWRVYF